MDTVKNLTNTNKALEVISNDTCSLIVFFSNNELSGLLQMKTLRISLSFTNSQFWKIIAICEHKLDPSGTYKFFEHHEEKYPYIWQLSAEIRLYLTQPEWLDICEVFNKAKARLA